MQRSVGATAGPGSQREGALRSQPLRSACLPPRARVCRAFPGPALAPSSPTSPHAPELHLPPSEPSPEPRRPAIEGAGPWTRGQGSARGGSREKGCKEPAQARSQAEGAEEARRQRRDSRGAPRHERSPGRRKTRVSRPRARPQPGSLLHGQTPYLLAVVVARSRLPPRTTSARRHRASPAELAMSPAVALVPTCAAQRP